MSRTVEIGRAVLHSTNVSSHVWLTTAITVCSQSKSLNLQLLDQFELLELLLSGSCYVPRGYNLHLLLDILVLSEPLERDHVSQLIAMMREAPVWRQLGLEIDIPESEIQGQIRINITHRRYVDEENTARTHHRLGLNVPHADIKPPDIVPAISLNSVHLSLNILRPRQISKIKKRKFKVGTDVVAQSSYVYGASPTGAIRNPIEGSNEAHVQANLLGRPVTMFPPMQPLHFQDGMLQDFSVGNCDRQSRSWNDSNEIQPFQAMKLSHAGNRDQAGIVTTGQPVQPADLSAVIDAAMRMSVCRNASRVSEGVKVVTSSFSATLSEVCPILFAPRYLEALSPRAHFLPTLSRSMVRAVCSQEGSASLQDKLRMLLAEHPMIPGALTHQSDEEILTARLWTHLQDSLSERPLKSLQSFCPTRAAATCVESRLLTPRGILRSEENITGAEDNASSDNLRPQQSVVISEGRRVEEEEEEEEEEKEEKEDILLADTEDITI